MTSFDDPIAARLGSQGGGNCWFSPATDADAARIMVIAEMVSTMTGESIWLWN
jgi:hypothetical protein